MPIRKRILQALGANTFGQLVTIGSQLVLTPLFFFAWGADEYGKWLLLTTIPTYLLMADLGFGSAAANEMAILAGANKMKALQSTFWGALRICTLATAAVLALSVAAGGIFYLVDPFDSVLITKADGALIVLALGMGVCINFFTSMASAAFRSSGLNAFGIVLSNSIRLLEAVVSGVLLLASQSPLVLCLGGLLVRVMGGLMQLYFVNRMCPWIFAPGREVDRALFKRLIKPSLSFLAFPLGNALALQGPILILGLVFGSTSVAVFNTLRTLSRIPLQIANVVNASVWPEMSTAYGAGDLLTLRRLHQRSWLATCLLVLLAAMGIGMFGDFTIHLWLGKNFSYDALTLGNLVGIASLAAIWGVSAVVLTAINAHSRLVLLYLSINAICLALSYLLAITSGYAGFLFALLLAEALMLLAVFPMALAASADSFHGFVCSMGDNVRRILRRGATLALQARSRNP